MVKKVLRSAEKFPLSPSPLSAFPLYPSAKSVLITDQNEVDYDEHGILSEPKMCHK